MSLLWLALACGPGTDGIASYRVDEFTGWEGLHLEYGVNGNPATGLLLRMEPGAWALRRGETWTTATDDGTVAVDTSEGLRLDGVLVLPRHLAIGAALDGTEVVDIAEVDTWYGTFEETVTVEVDSGRFAGRQTFARHLGPIELTIDAQPWQLLYYE